MPRNRGFEALRAEHIVKPLLEHGFQPFKSSMLARIAGDWVLQVIAFTPNKHGGELAIDCVIRPLYASANRSLVLQPGNRMSEFLEAGGQQRVHWWPIDREGLRAASAVLSAHGLPWFDANQDAAGILAERDRQPHPWWNQPTLIAELGHVMLRARRPREALAVFSTKPSRVPKHATLVTLVAAANWEAIDRIQHEYVAASVRNLKLERLARLAGLDPSSASRH